MTPGNEPYDLARSIENLDDFTHITGWSLDTKEHDRVAWKHDETGAVVTLRQRKPEGRDLPFAIDFESPEEASLNRRISENDWFQDAVSITHCVLKAYHSGHTDTAEALAP